MYVRLKMYTRTLSTRLKNQEEKTTREGRKRNINTNTQAKKKKKKKDPKKMPGEKQTKLITRREKKKNVRGGKRQKKNDRKHYCYLARQPHQHLCKLNP